MSGPRRADGPRRHTGLRWLAALLLSGLVVSGASLGIFSGKEPPTLPAPRTWPACGTEGPDTPRGQYANPAAAARGGAGENGMHRPGRGGRDVNATLIAVDDADGPAAFQVYATRAANLVSHFGPVRVIRTSAYRAGMLGRHRALVYVGLSSVQRLPAALRHDVLAGRGPVLWLGGNIGALTTPTRFAEHYGWRWGGSGLAPRRAQRQGPEARPPLPQSAGQVRAAEQGLAGVDGVRYKGVLLSRDPTQGPIGAFAGLDPRRARVLATAVTTDGRTRPWAVRSGNLTYVAEAAVNVDEDDDRFLAVSDLLFDLLAPGTPARHRALVRLEDLGPQADPEAIRAAGETLYRLGVPFSFGVIPIYRGPLPDGPKRATIRLRDRPELVRALVYLLDHGGTMVLHGYTHQSDGPPNPTNGESGQDFEFFRTHFDARQRLVYDGAIHGDSSAWMEHRLDQAMAEVRAAGLPEPRIFEVPHYAASPADYRVIARRFAARYDRGSYFTPGWQGHAPVSPYMDEQFAPYVIRDVYGSVVIPESLGLVELRPTEDDDGTPATILEHARAQLVVRDNVAGFFYHPFLGTDRLERIVGRMRSMGYRFEAPCRL
ncbi:DUF2334 domain-containing protein [Nonomuraea sp. SMC257]|uniref:DUF2334 domain-containing protein n=1 Tax=Nonomuraea montanisoli TaxID=2741721 RepID=A0A7Y6I955_9ACTN|nr:DUF2334 domain-containing protein [Nonomuraea montanisoli]NUW33821.1 DUF2334 domain-containing protein [Nonomuraea montanisoli]